MMPAFNHLSARSRSRLALVFVTLIALGLWAQSTLVVEAAAKESQILCFPSHQSFADPIVYPSQPQATGSHMHQFFGSTTTDAFSTYETMVASDTSCKPDEPKDTAGYWVPVLYVGADPPASGQPMKPGVRVYYTRPQTFDGKNVAPIDQVFPPDFRMIAGVGSAMTPEQNPLVTQKRLWWFCYPVARSALGGPPVPDCLKLLAANKNGGGRMDMYLTFPSCWVYKSGPPEWKRNAKGEVIDSTDHRAHVAYPTGAGCPATHPRRLPQVRLQVIYQPWNTGEYFSSGPWWTVHADFWNTWDQTRLEQIVATL